MINQHEANIVKYIFESYAKVMVIVRLRTLNHKGYVTKKGNLLVFHPLPTSSQTLLHWKIRFAKYRTLER